MRIDIRLGGEEGKRREEPHEGFEYCDEESSEAARKFLKAHKHAKIIVVIDAHCLEDGLFIWKGHDQVSYETCTLWEVCPYSSYSFP